MSTIDTLMTRIAYDTKIYVRFIPTKWKIAIY